jgi:hypothetical protein
MIPSWVTSLLAVTLPYPSPDPQFPSVAPEQDPSPLPRPVAELRRVGEGRSRRQGAEPGFQGVEPVARNVEEVEEMLQAEVSERRIRVARAGGCRFCLELQ